MSKDIYSITSIPDADVIPFDPESSGIAANEVGPALRELANAPAVSASPGFTWGDSGSIKQSYLLNDTVPSNQSGRVSPVSGVITTVFITAQNSSNGQVEIRKRSGSSFTTIATVGLNGGRTITETLSSPPAVLKNEELAVFVNATAFIDNPVVGIVIRGSL